MTDTEELALIKEALGHPENALAEIQELSMRRARSQVRDKAISAILPYTGESLFDRVEHLVVMHDQYRHRERLTAAAKVLARDQHDAAIEALNKQIEALVCQLEEAADMLDGAPRLDEDASV